MKISKAKVLKTLETELKTLFNYNKKIKDSDHLQNDLGLDSLDRIELWIAVEDKYNLDIPEDEIKKITTVKEILELVEKYGDK